MLRRPVSWLTSAALILGTAPAPLRAQPMMPKGAPMAEPVQPVQAVQPEPPPAPEQPQAAIFNPEQLDAILAPIALYPDVLLTQVLMASAFPLQLIEANRWAQANRGITGEALERALAGRNWDPSVKSLVPFPGVLAQLTGNLEWLQDLGTAAVQQQPDVLDAVQRLRQRAAAAGNLRSNDQCVVRTEDRYIYIEPAQPQLVYVPAYNPVEVYGVWAYPAYPPVYLPPPVGYGWGPIIGAGLAFGAGIAITAALWNVGWPNWGGHNIYVNGNVYNNITINRTTINNFNNNVWNPRQATTFNRTAFASPIGGGNAPWRGPEAARVQNFRAQQFGGPHAGGFGGAGGAPVYRSNQFGPGGGHGGNQFRYNGTQGGIPGGGSPGGIQGGGQGGAWQGRHGQGGSQFQGGAGGGMGGAPPGHQYRERGVPGTAGNSGIVPPGGGGGVGGGGGGVQQYQYRGGHGGGGGGGGSQFQGGNQFRGGQGGAPTGVPPGGGHGGGGGGGGFGGGGHGGGGGGGGGFGGGGGGHGGGGGGFGGGGGGGGGHGGGGGGHNDRRNN